MAIIPKDINVVEEDVTGLSRINAAGLINATLEKLWSESFIAMANGNYLLQNTKLDAIWIILGGDVEEKDADDVLMNSINDKIYKQGSFKSKVGTGFSQKANPNIGALYHLLKEKSLFLKRLQNRQGKGTAYKSPDDDDMD